MLSVKSIIFQHPNYNVESLIQSAAKYEYVSFDIFDTLIKRAVAKPDDVFLLAANVLIEREKLDISPEQLAQARRNAASEAYKKKTLHQEITLDDIYAELPGEYQDIALAYRAAELDTERTVCHADPVLKKVYDWCREQHKKIILISDMYLDQDFMAELLSRCGYTGYEALYVSSWHGVTKQSGALYGEVYKQIPFAKGQVIHIGDSITRDWLRARQQHFSSKLIARDPLRSKYIKINDLHEEQRKLWGRLRTVINGYEDTQWPAFYRYGFEVVGPLLYGFCKWLHDTVQEHREEKLFFLARDGYLLWQAYNSMYGSDAIENCYLYLSTIVMRRVQAWMGADPLEVISAHPPRTFIKLEDFCQLFGVERDALADICKSNDLELNDYFLPEAFSRDPRLVAFCEQIKHIPPVNAKELYQKTIKYLRQQHFEGKAALVDIGWRGTIQNYLQTLINAETDLAASLTGYYLGFKEVAGDTGAKFSFIPDTERAYEFVTSFFEFPFPPPEGTVIGYEERGGIVYPISHVCEFDEDERAKISMAQKGALHFIECAKNEPVFDVLTDVNTAYANMWRISRKPTLQEVRLFGDLSYYSYSKHQLAAPKVLFHYVLHPQELPYDLSVSGWKNAFLKRLLKVGINYYDLLKRYKRRQ